ncbi:hypothetical protein vBAbaPP1_117 [Acinetobacter phage vB_AbaM_P1]|nr:hypothetical protein vBAbaPP1_117 [Acinetobacter phage vB_AbaM_P1]WAX22598.1 hypothetical protein [Acinetobacter phage vB_AbaP_HB01]
MAFKIYDLDDSTFLVETNEDDILFGYSCDVRFLTDEIEVNNIKVCHLSDNIGMSENEVKILEDEVSDRKSELESMIIEYWIKERKKESDD